MTGRRGQRDLVHAPELHAERSRRRGFTTIEIVVGLSLIVVGLLILGGVMITASHHREQLVVESLVLARAESLMEEIKAVAANDVKTFDGNEYPVTGVQGNYTNGNAIRVQVDSTNDRLLVVNVDGSWILDGTPHTLQLQTARYNAQGN